MATRAAWSRSFAPVQSGKYLFSCAREHAASYRGVMYHWLEH